MVSSRGWLAVAGFVLALVAFIVLLLRLRRVAPAPMPSPMDAARAAPTPSESAPPSSEGKEGA